MLHTASHAARLVGLILLGALVAPLRGDPEDATPPLLPALALKRMSIEELLAQQVTSVSRKPENLSEAAGSVFLIRGLSVGPTGAKTLPELLRLAPNLFVAQASSATWAVSARGFVRANAFSNKLLVMIDGRTVYSPLFSNVFWDATTIFLPDLQQVEVISGPAGSTWGANAVNGVINITTKSAKDTLGGLLFADTGNRQDDFGVRYGLKLGAEAAMRVYFQRSRTDATLSSTGADDGADAWNLTSGGFRADWTGANSASFTVSGDAFSGRYHNPGAPNTANDGANLLARWASDLADDSHLWVRFYYDYSKRDSQAAITETTRTSDFEFQHRLDFKNGQEILWGGNYRLISDSIDHTAGFVVLPPQLRFVVGSIFGQHEINFLDDSFRLTTGLRIEHNHFSGLELQPSLRLAWVRPGQTFWISSSRATRIPSRLETGYFYPATPPYLVVGGAKVVSELVQATELGWRAQASKALSFTTTLFYNDYDHLRSVEPTTPVTFANGVEGQSYGVEFFADWQTTDWWRMRFGGFRIAQDTWLSSGGADLENARGESSFPKYQFQFRNTFRLAEGVSLWTAVRHVSEVLTYENGVAGVVPAYTELDVSLDWKIRTGLELSITGRNLLDASHAEIGSLAARREIPRSVQAEVRYGF
ncbi:MAG: TonB-dependent receptor, plug [Verrucomicrobia bacterium]|nr:TonB-dependent receptor, plug [Verrucomicrobiota bacterium]